MGSTPGAGSSILDVPMRACLVYPRAPTFLLCSLAVAVIACDRDLFHATDWATLCDVEPSAPACLPDGGGGAGGVGGMGGGDAGVDVEEPPAPCVPCANLVDARSSLPPDRVLCPSSADIYALLTACRCDVAGGVCQPNCALTPACGGASTDTAKCDACVETSCGALVLSCLERTAP
jgi:hypothetical protein